MDTKTTRNLHAVPAEEWRYRDRGVTGNEEKRGSASREGGDERGSCQDGREMAGDSKPEGNRLQRFYRELSQRKVCRAAITYALVLWLNLQIGDVMFPIMGLPPWTLKLVMFVGLMGFPVVVLLAWTFQITPRGIELDVDPAALDQTDRYLDRVVSMLLLVLSVILTVLLTVQIL